MLLNGKYIESGRDTRHINIIHIELFCFFRYASAAKNSTIAQSTMLIANKDKTFNVSIFLYFVFVTYYLFV